MAKWILKQLSRIIKKLWRTVIFILSLPIVFMLILLFPFYKIKFVSLFSDRIGHYAMNTELLLCYLDEIRLTENRVKYLFYTRDAPICNKQLHTMWKRIIPILLFTQLAARIDSLMFLFFKERYKNAELKKFEISTGNVDSVGRFKKHPVHLSFTADEIKQGRKLLLALGVPIDAKFVCLLVRDPAYLNAHFSTMDWSHHFYRDCDIDNFTQAALYLANKGYYVIRMGKTVAKRFDVAHPLVIDYANHPLRSDFGDIYLTAHCAFFISTASGLDGVAQIFRKPILQVNIAPLKHQLQFWYPCKLFVIKKIFDNTNVRCVTLKEMDERIKDVDDLQALFNALNWTIIENTPEEIVDAVQEMEAWVTQKNSPGQSNPFHDLLKTPLSFSMIDHRDFLRNNSEKFYTRMVEQFWKENQSLILE